MRILFFLFIVLLGSCKTEKQKLSAQQIIDKTIETAGGDRYNNAEINFTFRNIKYKSIRQNSRFSLQRMLPDTLNTLDIITNEGFMRIQNEEQVVLHDTTAVKYEESVNSVHYFMHLPFGLNDEAVKKKLLGEVTIKDKQYYKLEVTFKEEGGGVDYQDIFLYWVSKDNFTIDYLAYKFFTNEGGIRFRESFNPRVIKGIRFVDYKNYSPQKSDVDFYKIDDLYKKGKLKELSVIENKNIEVQLLTPGSV
ncbi:DUF6503 family protein [uncultured Planktosalinus sp.]|uniref:DUF6503 family protein n=1 Tax=uncultured Planktosalinus sp. TaxID=1810935 RepID=UPI0030DDAF67